MKQYNRIMLGEHGKYLDECLAQNFIGANFFCRKPTLRTFHTMMRLCGANKWLQHICKKIPTNR